MRFSLAPLFVSGLAVLLVACDNHSSVDARSQAAATKNSLQTPEHVYAHPPLVTHIYTADPAAHVFNGRIYIYPSHDIESDIPANDAGDHFAMRDYRVLSMAAPGGEVTDHGVALDIAGIPWAGRQLWAPDAAEKDGLFYLYFPVKDHQDIFRIGVAVSDKPEGPFTNPQPIEGAWSNDPAVYQDEKGHYYLYTGGISGGQLQRWTQGRFAEHDQYPADDQPALLPKIARLNDDMVSLAEPLTDVPLLDASGQPLLAGDRERRFFEGVWVHRYQNTYYFSWSTGDTHKIAYATGDNPYGPFTYRGVLLEPVTGWTTHHSIISFNDQWYLFYHDSSLSGGQTHLRSIKMTPLNHRDDGSIETISAFR